MAAPGLDFETWDISNLNARNYAVRDLEAADVFLAAASCSSVAGDAEPS